MILAHSQSKKTDFVVDDKVFPQTLAVLETRAKPLGINIIKLDLDSSVPLEDFQEAFGLLVQLPNSNGKLRHCDGLLRCAEVYKCMKIAIVDPMCQVLMKPVGEWGCLLYTSPSPRDRISSRMPSSA